MTDLHHLAAAYAVDALESDERREFEEHYPTCEICALEVLAFRETAAQLAMASSNAPPPDLKARLMARVATTEQLPASVPSARTRAPVSELQQRRAWRGRDVFLGAVAAAVIAVVATVGALRIGAESDSIEDVIAAPDSIVTDLEGADGTVRIVWSASRDQAAVFGNGMADPGPNLAYALWFVVDDGVVPAGLFTPDDGKVRQVLDLDDIDPGGWGVTIEPDTGSDQPTSEIIFSGPV